MKIDYVNKNTYKPQYKNTTFCGNPIKFYSCKLNLTENIVELIEESRQPYKDLGKDIPLSVLTKFYKEHEEANNKIFLEHIRPSCRELVNKFIQLPTYSNSILPFMIDLKKSELEYLYKLATKIDILGEMRIPGVTFHYFSEIPEERLKLFEPLMLSKNDAGMWNYSPSFILQLNKHFRDYHINIMSRLADCKVNGLNLRQIALNPYINHEKTIEKAQGLKQLFGDKLREIEFLSNRNGENYLSADIQLPHTDNKPDYFNFKRVFSLLDKNVDPIAKKTKNTEIDNYIDKIYKDLQIRMHVFTAYDLEKSIRDVEKAVPESEEHEILRTMQKLTQFANYTSLKKIAPKINHELHPAGGINPYFYYFSRKKFIFDLPFINNGTKSSFVTKDDIHSKDFNKLLKRAQGSDMEWVNLEGWSDGINLFTDDKTLTEKTIKVLKHAKKIQSKNEDYTFNDALSLVLNKEIISGMKKYNYEIKTITFDPPATRDVILSQLSPAMPTQSLLKSTIESISNYYTHSTKSANFKKTCMKIAKYYQDNLQVYSKQRIIESLKQLHLHINQCAQMHEVHPQNIYYILPSAHDSEYQSFELITKMYCDLHSIPKENIVKINNFKDVNKYPKNSVFVLLDDIVGSGDSMTRFGDYKHCAKEIQKDKHIFFCPVSAMEKGLKYIKYQVEHAGRESEDVIISINNNTTKKSNIATDFIINGLNPAHNSRVLGNTGHCNAGLCHVFPYIGPDNDSVLASYVIKFFVPDAKCIKNKTNTLPVIEENTYYYDIFGTDKDHILTSAQRVYTPTKLNKLISCIKKFFNHE